MGIRDKIGNLRQDARDKWLLYHIRKTAARERRERLGLRARASDAECETAEAENLSRRMRQKAREAARKKAAALARRKRLGLPASATVAECVTVEEAASKAEAEEQMKQWKKAEAEEAARKKAEAEEAARKKAEAEEAARKRAEAEEAARKRAEAEEAARKRAEAKAEEAARKKAEAENARKAAIATINQSSLEQYNDLVELAKSGVIPMEIGEAANNFLSKLFEHLPIDTDTSFTFEAYIEDFQQMGWLLWSLDGILIDLGLSTGSMFHHDGWLNYDRPGNSGFGRSDECVPTSVIEYVYCIDWRASTPPNCPCCGGWLFVRAETGPWGGISPYDDREYIDTPEDIRADLELQGSNSDPRPYLQYRCDGDCELTFRFKLGGWDFGGSGDEGVWDGDHPACKICESNEEVEWLSNDRRKFCSVCDMEDPGCGTFRCSDCDHHIDWEGDCVDPECDCEDWGDDDDDDDDDDWD